ncbi:taurine catabolism dioxygenase tauD, tfdA family domain-containing protein [Ditylenchus destructor]|uniref:Taurine catabolism dioxygenase tauD, tfdA family domain-containing protein n=1 Tax=Ditylenchus destructor TaxID=166010 RepID=A0AAD4R8F4_9BILA|nr:taurine catabolism dioxygenase tauD, tfdA family domain-containing protein [Ditylenchus destructor]
MSLRARFLCLRRNIHAITNLAENRAVQILFEDGTSGHYPYVWLRDCSLDSKTYSITDSIKARQLLIRDFDINVCPERIHHDVPNNSLVIHWPGGATSRYDKGWLWSRNPTSTVVRNLRRKFYLEDTKPWNTEEIIKRLCKFQHGQFLKEEKVLHDFLTAVSEDGIAILTNGPTHDGVVNNIGERIGFIHRTHFGIEFKVAKKENASNMAYASGDELPYHTDFPSLSQPPQLQLLHMMQRATEGGVNMFVDGFKVAELMKAECPDLYKILCEAELEYIEEGYDVHEIEAGKEITFHFDMVARHKVFTTNDEGRVVKVQFGNAMRTLKTFTMYCYRPDMQLLFYLENGDTVLWANTRLLHARSAYSSAPNQERSIAGCYFSWDIVKSRIRLARDRLQLPENQLSV